MQSGITASKELHDAFNELVSSPSQRALLASIENESLVPNNTIPLQNETFTADLDALQSHLTPHKAAYILLKTHPEAADGYAAITYVPNAAPVRQKMLFASTRLTLARELGIERFRQTIFATEKSELTAEGWEKHEKHVAQDAPLTEEESGLKGVKDAEARESQGTTGRRGHVETRHDLPVGEGVLEALSSLMQEGCKGTLVQLKYALPDETLQLDSSTDNVAPTDLSKEIHAVEPRFSFYSVPEGGPEPNILFIYSCPTASKIKERMLYSTSKTYTRIKAENAGLVITKSVETTEPADLDAEALGLGGATASAKEEEESRSGSSTPGGSGGFARPKRPGRR